MPSPKKRKALKEVRKKVKAFTEKLDKKDNVKPRRKRTDQLTGMPTGRPSSRYGIDLDKVYSLCLLGLTNQELAVHFKIDDDTFYQYVKDWKEFSDTLVKGRDEADATITRSVFRRANGFSHPEEVIKTVKGRVVKVKTTKKYPPDTQAAMYWLNNRQRNRWKNKLDDENVNVAPTGPVVVNIITDEDTKARLLKLEQESNRGNVVNDEPGED